MAGRSGACGLHGGLARDAGGGAAMPEAQLPRLFWETLDRAAYTLMDARLWLFELIHGPEPADSDEKREPDRMRLETLPVIDFGALMAAADEPQDTKCNCR